MKNSGLMVIYGYVAPVAAPFPSAYVLGLNVYNSILSVSGERYWWIAGIVALVGMIGIESTGGLAALLISRSVVLGSWYLMRLAIAAVVAYAVFVAIGIYSSADSRPMVATVALTLLAYFVVAIWEAMKASEAKKAEDIKQASDQASEKLQAAETEIRRLEAERMLILQTAEAKTLELDAETKRLDAERKLTNSKTREEKASRTFSASVEQQPTPDEHQQTSDGQQTPSTGRPAKNKHYDQVILDAVIELLNSDPEASTRDIVKEEIGIRSPDTALRYRTRALEVIEQLRIESEKVQIPGSA